MPKTEEEILHNEIRRLQYNCAYFENEYNKILRIYQNSFSYKFTRFCQKYLNIGKHLRYLKFYFLNFSFNYFCRLNKLLCRYLGHSVETINNIEFCTRRGCTYSKSTKISKKFRNYHADPVLDLLNQIESKIS